VEILVTLPHGFIRDTFLSPDVVAAIESLGTVAWNPYARQFTPDELRTLLRGRTACITGWGAPYLSADVLQDASDLRLVVHTGGSVAALLGDEVYDKGIRVSSGNRLYAESVAEGVLAYLLCALRDIVRFSAAVQAGEWPRVFHNQGLLDQRVGLVGFGAVARDLARLLAGFRVDLRVYDPFVGDDVLRDFGAMRAASLDELCATCPIVSLHLPRTPETVRILDRRRLGLLPDGALLVNTARGQVVDNEALADELASGRLRAVLDVFDEEPPPADCRLLGLPNALLMPHMAGPTVDRRSRIARALVEDAARFLAGGRLEHGIDRAYARTMTR
jgi:phosphoglycerate dehydrogenase-like enzyme